MTDKELHEFIESYLDETFAWDLLNESGSPKEGQLELIMAVKKLINNL
jgi:hypothetical protein